MRRPRPKMPSTRACHPHRQRYAQCHRPRAFRRNSSTPSSPVLSPMPLQPHTASTRPRPVCVPIRIARALKRPPVPHHAPSSRPWQNRAGPPPPHRPAQQGRVFAPVGHVGLIGGRAAHPHLCQPHHHLQHVHMADDFTDLAGVQPSARRRTACEKLMSTNIRAICRRHCHCFFSNR